MNSSALRQWALVWLATTAGFIAAFNVGKVSAALPLLQEDLSLGLAQGGLLASAYSVLAMCGAMVLGVVVSRFGPWRCALAGLALMAIGSLFGVTANTYTVLLLSRLIEGAGYVSIAVAMPALITASVDERRRPMAMGVWGTFIPVGIAIGLLASPPLLAIGGWHALWWCSAALAAGWFVVFFRAARRVATPLQRGSGRGAIRSVLKPASLLLAGCFCLYSMSFSALTIFLPSAWADSAIGLDNAARLTALVALCNMLGNLCGGWLLSRGVSFKRLITLALLLGNLLAVPVFLQSIPVAAQAWFACLAIMISGMLPACIFANVRYYVKEVSSVGPLLGLVFQGAASGQVLAPWIVGTLVDNTDGWHYAPLFFVAIALLASVLLVLLPPPGSTD